MAEKLPYGYWDIDGDSTDDSNIEAILYHIEHYTDIPTEAMRVLRRALAERDARIADLLRVQDEQAAPGGANVQRVKMPATKRRAYSRDVQLIDYTRVCRHCGRSEIVTVYPTAKPTICERSECQQAEKERLKQLNAERQKRYRARHAGNNDGAAANKGQSKLEAAACKLTQAQHDVLHIVESAQEFGSVARFDWSKPGQLILKDKLDLLVKLGYLTNSGIGKYALTGAGRAYLADNLPLFKDI